MTHNVLTQLMLLSSLSFGFCWLLFELSLLLVARTSDTPRYHDYCVIGAGPAGLQMGYFFQIAGRDYVVFERSNSSGEVFTFGIGGFG